MENNFWIDTHAHIYAKEFDADRADTIHRSEEHQVKRIFMPNVDHTSIDAMLETEHRWPGKCEAMMGLHPCSVDKDFQRELYVVEDWLSKRKFAAIGEIGTDLYWDKTFWEQQKEAFTVQINWAKQYELPVVIHCRDSLNETIEIVENLQDGGLTGIFHCFSGSVEQAKKIASLNFFVGIGGVATFKKGGLDLVMPEVPIDSIVLETDCPYLAPVPHRGKRNEPGYIPLIAQKLAEIKKMSWQELQAATTKNALQLFRQK